MKKIRQSLLVLVFTLSALLFTPRSASAIDICDYFPPCTLFKTPADLVNRLVPIAMAFAGFAFFILLIVAGFQVIMHAGSGDPKELAKWRSTLVAALMGLGLVISAFWIVQLIKSLTGANIPGF